MDRGKKVGMRFRSHTAPCGLPCKTIHEANRNEVTHTITEECPRCLANENLWREAEARYLNSAPIKNDNHTKGAATALLKAKERKVQPPSRPSPKPIPPEPKTPWEKIVIPPHALKMVKIRAGFASVVDAANMIERLYPLAEYRSSQKEAKGTSHTKRTKPGKNKHKSQRVDLYVVTDNGVIWIFYMKRNVLMTVHRGDDLDRIGPRSGLDIVENPST